MNKSEKKYPLKGFIDTHLHTAPDIQPRLINDIEAAKTALNEKMGAVVIKSHVEPTSGRARLAQQATGCKVFGGVCLNSSVGGLNVDAVKTSAAMGGKVVWLPTITRKLIDADFYGNNQEVLEDIFTTIIDHDLILATGHLRVEDIFQVLDQAVSMGVEKIIINHPLTRVVGATIPEQKEMSRKAYLEHCYVACLPHHDHLDPAIMARAIKDIGAKRCIMATDLGQMHNPHPNLGFKRFIDDMLNQGISWRDIKIMCRENPYSLFF